MCTTRSNKSTTRAEWMRSVPAMITGLPIYLPSIGLQYLSNINCCKPCLSQATMLSTLALLASLTLMSSMTLLALLSTGPAPAD